jgi:hypothetical protein
VRSHMTKAMTKDREPTLRILQIGSSERLQAIDGINASLSVFEPEFRRRESAAAVFGRSHAAVFLEAFPQPGCQFDVILADDGLSRLPPEIGPDDVYGLLAPGGLLLAIAPPESLFRDMVFHFASLSDCDNKQRSYRPSVEGVSWLETLRNRHFIEAKSLDFGGGRLLVAKARRDSSDVRSTDALADDRPAIIVIEPIDRHKAELPTLLERQLGEAGVAVVFGIGAPGTTLPAAAGDALSLVRRSHL